MAAGEGRRLRPLTETWPKPLLPIDGRPVLATLLRELAAAGLTRVTVVTGHLADQLEELVGDGGGFGVEARCVRQPEHRRCRRAPSASRWRAERRRPRSSSPRTRSTGRARSAASPRPSRPRAPTERSPSAATRRPGPGREAVRVEDGLVTRVPDDDPANKLASAALWGLGPAVAARARARARVRRTSWPTPTSARSTRASGSRPSRSARPGI